MSSLYKDPEWSESSERAEEVIQTMNGPTVSFKKAVQWLRTRKSQDPDFSLTDMWGALVGAQFMKEVGGSLRTLCLFFCLHLRHSILNLLYFLPMAKPTVPDIPVVGNVVSPTDGELT